MKVLIIILAVIGGIIALVLIIALFSRKDYTVTRSITINKPAADIYTYIRHLRNQMHYNKFTMADPNQKVTYRGTDGTVGFVMAWNGNKQAGEGEQEIKNLVENERMDIELRFVRPFAGVSQAPFILTQKSPTETEITWGMSSRMPYPMNFILVVADMDSMLGKELEASLMNLKNIMEKS